MIVQLIIDNSIDKWLSAKPRAIRGGELNVKKISAMLISGCGLQTFHSRLGKRVALCPFGGGGRSESAKAAVWAV